MSVLPQAAHGIHGGDVAGYHDGVSYHGAVSEFKRRLIETTLHRVHGNRTHAARVLGLQRTYLLRLIRDLGVAAPPPPPRRRAGG